MADDSKTEHSGGTKREIITINVGGFGVGLAQTLTEQYCTERGIAADGVKKYKRESDDSLSIQFDESMKGEYRARSLMVDLDPYTINNVRNVYEYRSVLKPSCLMNGQHDASCNFAIANYSSGRELLDNIKNELRHLADSCEDLQGFTINHGLSGGTGSGITALILDLIAANYKKKTVAMYSSMHHETFLSHPTMVYNAILFMDKAKDHCDYSVIVDNASLYNIVQHQLKIKTPRFKHYNCILSKLISSITAPSRYNINHLGTICSELVPFPHLKYLLSSMSPIVRNDPQILFKKDIQSLTNQCTQPRNFMLNTPDFDVEEDKYIALSFMFRGKRANVDKEKAMHSLKWIEKEKKICFVEKAKHQHATLQFHESLPDALPSDDIITADKLVTMIANNTCISRLFTERICKVYDLLYSQRAYVHHYVAQGLEEKAFSEARNTLSFIEEQYRNVLSSQ